MHDTLRPTTTAEAAAIISDACAAHTTLEIIGTGTRRGYGGIVDAGRVLDLSGLTGVVDYDPAELVLTARPGTPMREIEVLVAEAGQHLAFEPPDLAPLWGGPAGGGTIGGALACGIGGSRRLSAGAPRDHFLGFEAVNGSGEIFHAGGKVIKNVTGYDLPKLMTGSFGTLAVLTEITIKVLPAPRAMATLVLTGLSEAAAIAAMTVALNSPAVVTGAAHFPASISNEGEASTRLRLEGVAVAVDAYARQLSQLLTPFGRVETVDSAVAAAAWHDISAVHPFTTDGEIVWRIVLPPSTAASFVAALDHSAQPRWYFDWGGGLVWLMLPPASDSHAAVVRGALAATAGADGHATLVRAPDVVRRSVAVFEPLEPGLAALSERVRARFDLAGILNPGRMLAREAAYAN